MVAFGALLGWLLLGGTVMAADSVEEAELNETVVCTNDHMEVVIPAAFFLNKVPPVYVWDLHLNDPECRGVQVGDDYVFSVRTNLSDCGTITVRRSHLQEGRVGGGAVHQTLHVNVDATNRADISVYGDEDKPPLPAINYPFYGVVGILRPARMSVCLRRRNGDGEYKNIP